MVGLQILRQYWQTAAMAVSGNVGESPLLLLDYLLRFLRVVVLLSLWRTIFSGRDLQAGMSLGTVLTYTLAGEVFRHQLECRGSGLGWAIWEGAIATRYASRVRISDLLEQAASKGPILDVETHRVAIDDVIADIYEKWQGATVGE